MQKIVTHWSFFPSKHILNLSTMLNLKIKYYQGKKIKEPIFIKNNCYLLVRPLPGKVLSSAITIVFHIYNHKSQVLLFPFVNKYTDSKCQRQNLKPFLFDSKSHMLNHFSILLFYFKSTAISHIPCCLT